MNRSRRGQPRVSPLLPRLLSIFVLIQLLACGGGSSPTAPGAPPPSAGSASFRIVGAGQDEPIAYSSGPNLVFCRRDAGFADLFIRFAEERGADGANGRHLDIDVCNLGDGGTFQARDPRSTDCGSNKTWSVFWHGGEAVYSNLPAAPSCTLEIRRSGSMLLGNFDCPGLVEIGGSRMVDVLGGTFDCTEV